MVFYADLDECARRRPLVQAADCKRLVVAHTEHRFLRRMLAALWRRLNGKLTLMEQAFGRTPPESASRTTTVASPGFSSVTRFEEAGATRKECRNLGAPGRYSSTTLTRAGEPGAANETSDIGVFVRRDGYRLRGFGMTASISWPARGAPGTL